MLEAFLVSQFRGALAAAAQQAFDAETPADLDIQFAPTPSPEVGDLGFGCFPLAKTLRRSPKEIAERLADAIELPPLFRKAQAVGPYLNVFLDGGAFLRALCEEIDASGQNYGAAPAGSRGTLAIEFSSPNTNKPQHLGHIRNNVLGMALARILEAAGHEVVKVNLINDRGVHICKSMLAYLRWGEGETPESTGAKGDHFVGKYYVRFAQEAKQDPTLEEQAQAMLQKWEAGDPETIALWKTMNGWVYDGFAKTYERLGVAFDRVYHESETYRAGRDIILDALERGCCYRLDDGAIEVDLTDEGLDKKILLRRDGTSVYITQDCGTAVKRHEDLDFDAMHYVVGSEQIYHFRVLFALLEQFGYEWAHRCRHISYGMVNLPEGKMKSREGTVVDADDLMDEVEALSAAAIRGKHDDLAPEELDRRKRQIALGAIKFYLLVVTVEKDILFDPAASVSFEGDTGPYVQYSHTRICGILRKAAEADLPEADWGQLGNPDEVQLGLRLMGFPTAIREAAADCNPAKVANAVLDLARAFAHFYHDNHVLQAETPELASARLALCRAVQAVLKRGLELLGIEAPERM